MAKLSVLIPGRNEMFMARTVRDVLQQSRGDTEVIAVVDGGAAGEPLPEDPRVRVVVNAESIGQRQSTNQAARLSKAEFVMKLDAHCTVAEGFDVELMKECEPDWTVIPRMYNLHAFDWVCKACNQRTYQGPTPVKCAKCRAPNSARRDMIWKPRLSRQTDFARFDTEPHFQYWGACGKKPGMQGDIANVMCCVGAGWFLRRERYWELGGMDETHGSWGQMGVELACKSWLSGGRQVVNKRTWFSHMFRTQGGDFGFPYPISGRQVDHARQHSRDLWFKNTWPSQTRPLSWLIEHFAPIPVWHDPAGAARLDEVIKAGKKFNGSKVSVAAPSQPEAPAIAEPPPSVEGQQRKGVVYYTDNRPDPKLLEDCRRQLRKAFSGPVAAVSINGPVSFDGFQSIQLDLERGYLTMFKQILAGLEASDADIVFFAEHDVLYHPSHFEFTPPRNDTFYYNRNVWKVDAATGRALHYDCDQTSGLCAYRQLLLDHYRVRVARVERDGYSMRIGFEPGTRSTARGGVDDRPSSHWFSVLPNVDVRHDKNLTPTRWSKEQFRNQKYTTGWTEAEVVPGWGRPQDFLVGK